MASADQFMDLKEKYPRNVGNIIPRNYATFRRILPPIILFCLTLIPYPVSAYWDPGLGSILWQMFAALLLGAVYAVKVYWIRLKSFFKSKSAETK